MLLGKVRWRLRDLILILIMVVTLAVLLISFYASYRVQKQTLINNTLEVNHVYAVKLALNTDIFLRATIQRMAYNAQRLGRQFNNEDFLTDEVQNLLYETNSFNSIAIVDKDGQIKASAPASLGLNGIKVASEEALRSLQKREPFISAPYVSAKNNLLIHISVPIFADEEYKGYVGGAIYLNQKSILQSHLDEHYHKDGSYTYVVDGSRRLLYHPDKHRIGTLVGQNTLLDSAKQKPNGAQLVTNSRGVEMLAGFATVPVAGWYVVAQRPLDNTIAPIKGLILTVIISAIPLVLVIFILAWWLAKVISSPIEKLALLASKMDQEDALTQIQMVNPKYFEAEKLKHAMLAGLDLIHRHFVKLNHDADTDPLTGLKNRRGLDLVIDMFTRQKRIFSAIALDADHFKKINDQYGHDIGDAVLRRLAQMMRDFSREGDSLYRVGGEEFLMLLPDTLLDDAVHVAERLRQKAALTATENVSFTISLGVAQFTPGETNSTEAKNVLMNADQMLYEAKRAGRNCVKAYNSM